MAYRIFSFFATCLGLMLFAIDNCVDLNTVRLSEWTPKSPCQCTRLLVECIHRQCKEQPMFSDIVGKLDLGSSLDEGVRAVLFAAVDNPVEIDMDAIC